MDWTWRKFTNEVDWIKKRKNNLSKSDFNRNTILSFREVEHNLNIKMGEVNVFSLIYIFEILFVLSGSMLSKIFQKISRKFFVFAFGLDLIFHDIFFDQCKIYI